MPLQQMGRIAFREEGDHWNAYFAKQNTMDGALWLGSIALRFVRDNEARKLAFIQLMRDCFGDVCEELFKQRPVWKDPVPAPEHERSKNG